MPGVIVEVRCPKCDSPAVDREHGIGRLVAGILCFVGIGVPFFVYTTWRSTVGRSYEVPAMPDDVHSCCAARELSARHRCHPNHC